MTGFDDLKELAAVQGPCLSIFQPLRDEISQVAKPETRLRAAAQQADALLAENMFDATAREEFLRPIFKVAGNTDWSGRTGSMVIFRAPGYTRADFWPGTLNPTVRLADEFLILPLLGGLSARQGFWILALSIKQIHLFHGEAGRLSEVPLPEELPRSLEQAGGFDQPDHTLESRSSPGLTSGQIAAVRSGTTTVNETKGQYLHDFFKKIDRAIQPILAASGDPLILAAVARELAIYRELNTYPLLAEQTIHGSPEALGEARLLRAAMDIVQERAARKAEEARAEMDRAAGRGRLTTDLAVIEEAARNGRIERLFVEPNPAANEDRINRAALAAIRNSGAVAICDSLDTSVAAIMRYRATEAPQPELAASRV